MGGLHKVGGARAPLPTMVKNPSPVSGSLLIHYLNLFNCNVSSWKKDQHFPSALPHIFVILPLTARREMLQIFLSWCLTKYKTNFTFKQPSQLLCITKKTRKTKLYTKHIQNQYNEKSANFGKVYRKNLCDYWYVILATNNINNKMLKEWNWEI